MHAGTEDMKRAERDWCKCADYGALRGIRQALRLAFSLASLPREATPFERAQKCTKPPERVAIVGVDRMRLTRTTGLPRFFGRHGKHAVALACRRIDLEN